MINVAVVGYGGIGHMHVGNLRKMENVRVRHIVDIREEAFGGAMALNIGDAAGGSLEGIRCHLDFDAVLADPAVDVVLICTPTPCHRGQAERALRAGKHVICEKPLSLNPDEVRAMVRTATEHGKRLFGGFCIRFWPEYTVLYGAVKDGRYGRLNSVEFRRVSAPPRWSWNNWFLDGRQSGGALGDLHIHDLDFAVHLLGRPSRVFCAGVAVHSGEPDIVYTTLWCDGVPVFAHGTFANTGPFTMYYRAFFEQGVLEYDLTRDPKLTFQSYEAKAAEPIAVVAATGHECEMREFLAAIAADRPLPALSYESMIASAETYAAARRSVDLREAVSV